MIPTSAPTAAPVQAPCCVGFSVFVTRTLQSASFGSPRSRMFRSPSLTLRPTKRFLYAAVYDDVRACQP